MELKRDQYFSIVLTFRSKDGKVLSIARERSTSVSSRFLLTRAAIQPGQSFFRIDGRDWEDIYKENSAEGNLCIKAFTKNKAALPVNQPTPMPAPADIPKTGDPAPVTLWLAMMLLGMAGLGTIILRRHR